MSLKQSEHVDPERRSEGALSTRRVQQPWPKDREFKILSIDGGGIKGIYPATVLAELEERYLQSGESIAQQFDLITGTSTGGIIALGLSLGVSARRMADLYVRRGDHIFPPYPSGMIGRISRIYHGARKIALYRYKREALQALLNDEFGDHLLGDATARLCIPSVDGQHGDVYIFKTPHHPDYKKDKAERVVTVALATAAAPTFFQPLASNGYQFMDGGLWANNPVMVGLVDALACFDIDRHSVRILSLGCGDEPFKVTRSQVKFGGQFHWKNVIAGAMSYQSLNALGQASLLVGADRLLRLTPPIMTPPIALDDWARAKEELPHLAAKSVDEFGDQVARQFFSCASGVSAKAAGESMASFDASHGHGQ